LRKEIPLTLARLLHITSGVESKLVMLIDHGVDFARAKRQACGEVLASVIGFGLLPHFPSAYNALEPLGPQCLDIEHALRRVLDG
jgi:hypothetical protein